MNARTYAKYFLIASLSVFAALLCAGLSIAAGPTFVSGNISSHTKWTSSGSPYIVTNDVDVLTGVTLTIESGVSVEFSAGKSLIVHGRLKAAGTPEGTIVFSASVESAPKGYWGKIEFTATSNCSFEYCLVKDSRYGVRLSRSSIALNNCSFQNNLNAVSIDFSNAFSISNPSFVSNEVGVNFETNSMNVGILNGYFRANKVGVRVDKFSTLDISSTSMASNETGVWVRGSASVEIAGSEISFNKTGISVESYGAIDVTASRINSSESYGIRLDGQASAALHDDLLVNNWYTIFSPAFTDLNLDLGNNKIYANNVGAGFYGIGFYNPGGSTNILLKMYDNEIIGCRVEIYHVSSFKAGSYIERNKIISGVAYPSFATGIGISTGYGDIPLIRLNTIKGWDEALSNENNGSAGAIIRYNDLSGNNYGGYGGSWRDLRENYWGDPGGPGGSGSRIGATLLYIPWLTQPVSAVSSESVTAIKVYRDSSYTTLVTTPVGILDRVFISVEADTASIEARNWTSVIVTSESDLIVVPLIETSAASGIFNGEVRLDGNASTDLRGVIKATVNKSITFVPSMNRAINARVNIGPKAKWLKANSPEILPQVVLTLPSTCTLEIEPSVEVRYLLPFDTVSNQLYVNGQLIASGEPNSRIKFTSLITPPYAGSWTRVSITGLGSKGVFRYCDVEYGSNAINITNLASVEFSQCKFFRNLNSGIACDNSTIFVGACQFENNSFGMYIANIPFPRIVRVGGSNFFNNGVSANQGGIYISNANAYISGNNFSSNKQGIFANSSSAANVPYVRFNNFVNNNLNGIYNNSQDYPFSAPLNWWGTMEGPDVVDSRIPLPPPRSPKRGDNVSAFVYFEPFLLNGPVGFNPPSAISSIDLNGGNGVLEKMVITVLGTDASTESINWTTVRISSESDTSGMTLDLVETDLNTGTFEGTIRLAGNPSNTDIGILRARAGDRIFVSSTDFPLASSKGVSPVGTWELSESPEILERGIAYSLEAGSRLNIEAGVTVEFDDNAGLYINRGLLYASGEAGKRITFTSRRAYPTAGVWKSIRFSSQESAGSILSNCEIAYAQDGIILDTDVSLVIKNNTIRNSSSSGIKISSSVKPMILSNLITDNGSGISSEAAYPYIFGNIIKNNIKGINDINSFNSTIEANTISSNEYGIYVQPRSAVASGYNLIRGNTIEAGQNSSLRYCIYARTRDPLIRFNNLIGYDSDDYGVYMETFAYPVDARYNYWSSSRVGPYVVSSPEVPGLLSYSPPSSISSVKLFKDKARLLEASSCGILDRAFVSLAGADTDFSHYNYTTVIVSNESLPSKGRIFIDLVEASSGNFSGEARLNTDSDDWTDMIGSVVGDTIGFYSLTDPSKSDPLTVMNIGTWEKADSPEIFQNLDLVFPVLPAPSVLNIDPGVVVRSGAGIHIDTYSKLNPVGSKNDPITFASLNPNPAPGAWVGLGLYAGSSGSTIAYASISNAVTGVLISASSPLIAMVSFESSSSFGLDLQQSGTGGKAVDCNFVSNEVAVRGNTNYNGTTKVNYNNLLNSAKSKYGVNNTATANVTIDATSNYWDAGNGPGPIAAGSGLQVSSKVNYSPFLTQANVPGGPVASLPYPASGEATNRSMITLEARIFDPENVNLPSVTIEVLGEKVSWGDSRLSYDAPTSVLRYTPLAGFTEGVKTFEVVSAKDIFNEPLRAPLFSTFIIDLTSPEIDSVSALPYWVKAGPMIVTVEASDALSGIDHLVTPEVRVRYGNVLSGKATKQSYFAGSFGSVLSILGTFENGYATLEVSKVADLAGNMCIPSLEAMHVFIDTRLPTVEVISPFVGTTVNGPSTYLITWDAVSDPAPSSGFGPAPISIWLVVPGGQILITPETADTGTYSWSVPPLNVDNCRARVDVSDRAGNIVHGFSPMFSIETQNPLIMSTDPSDESTGVAVDSPISIIFSRMMSPETVENVFTITPYVAGTFEWSGDGKRFSYIPLGILSFSTTYEIGLGSGPIDRQGNLLLGTPFTFTFTTVFSETIKPVISNVRFDGRPYMDNDIISNRPSVYARILDNLGGSGVDKNDITIRFGTYVLKPGSYESSSGSMDARVVDYPLGSGNYTVTIEAVDRAGNQADPFTGRLRVMRGDVSVVGSPLAYPAPFKPLSGNHATIAYNLSTDADIVIHMYDISGNAVLTKKFRSGSEGGRAGYNSFDWNGITNFGHVVGNGIYVFKIVSGSKVLATGKLVVFD